ncbi:O-methyltransferase family 3 [Thermoanaerobacter italicus Ab9]|uniref:tRNA 5-hydroxyuridine methyltransferase n=1 Tax=Thermoanaerobacter italicus (strain DSM 9252 / Ab9) TaxID=580331 RepID=D3T8N5_THEIA|nr:O-methyltransferase [Thermoanaerobacter italicus]ADD02317.1 O-methyltransferase family 3 [Thermoanaerobacter italicus Ab9]
MELTLNDIKFIRETVHKFGYPLNEIEKYAKENFIPIAKPEVADFLSFIVRLKKPNNILEIGTAIGYSTIIMAKACSKVRIVTIERDINLAEIAKENFKKAKVEDRIELICGEAQQVFPNLTKNYDLIFVDAAKGQYIEFYKEVKRLLSKEGVILWDNILYKGYVVNEKNVKHKRRTIVYRMREFIEILHQDKTLYTVILPLGDGLAVSFKEE